MQPWRRRLGLALSVLFQLASLPGIIAGVEEWKQWIEMFFVPLWMHWVFFVVGFITMVYLVWPDLTRQFRRRRQKTAPVTLAPSIEVDYVGAMGIIDGYLSPAMMGMRDSVKLTIKKDVFNKFDKTTGAKLGEYLYNSQLLHQWMQANAARFLIDHRGDMS